METNRDDGANGVFLRNIHPISPLPRRISRVRSYNLNLTRDIA
jgi:hypothetical protein